MAFKTVGQLATTTTVLDGDLLPLWSGSGPLKSITASVHWTYIQGRIGTNYLQTANALSELTASASTARSNIGAASASAPTITNGMTFTGAVAGNVVTLGGSTIDVSQGEYQKASISTNTTFTFAGTVSGKWSGLLLEITTSSSAQPTFTGARWQGGAPPTLANGTHLFLLAYSGTAWTAVLMAAQIA